MSPRVQAVFIRFLVGLVLAEIPIATIALSAPGPIDWRLFAAGLLGGLAAAMDKLVSPQLANVLLPDTVYVPPDPAPVPKPAATVPVSASALLGAMQARPAQVPPPSPPAPPPTTP